MFSLGIDDCPDRFFLVAKNPAELLTLIEFVLCEFPKVVFVLKASLTEQYILGFHLVQLELLPRPMRKHIIRHFLFTIVASLLHQNQCFWHD